MPVQDIQVVSDIITETIAFGDPELTTYLECQMPLLFQYGQIACNRRLARMYMLQQALLLAMGWTRQNIERTEASGRSNHESKQDARSRADAQAAQRNDASGFTEGYASSDREWDRRSRDDANSFTRAFDGSNSTSRSDGYDRSTRSSRMKLSSLDVVTAREDGLSRTDENGENVSDAHQTSNITRTTGNGNGGVGLMTSFQINVPVPTVGVIQFGYSNGLVSHNHTINRENFGDGTRLETVDRFTGNITDSLTTGAATAEGSASDRRNVHRDGSSNMRQNGGLNAGSSANGEAHARSRSAAIREAHSRYDSVMDAGSSATTHSESEGFNLSRTLYRYSHVYYNQLASTLKVMAENVRHDIHELEVDISQAFSGVRVGHLRIQLPEMPCNPRAQQFANGSVSPCRQEFPHGCGMTNERWAMSVQRLTVY